MNKQQENMSLRQQKHIQATKEKPFFSVVKLAIFLLILFCGIAYKILISQKTFIQSSQETAINYALIGDIGGTNIRYQLISFTPKQKEPIEIIKQQRLKVIDFETFQTSITHFLADILLSTYPDTAVIAIAGPIQQNSVRMPNIPKWGKIDGNKLARLYNFSSFQIINDFQAASYGVLMVGQDQLIKLNSLEADPGKIRGVIGPGTGLGHSIIFSDKMIKDSYTVLPSQAGHSDVPLIDEETSEYVEFLEKRVGERIDLQKTFCGPSIPLMYEFYFKRLNQNITFMAKESPEIVQECIKERPDFVYQKVFELFMKFYSAAIANFMIQHMTTGGVYLVGSLTKAFLTKIRGRDLLKNWKQRHPDMINIIDKIPLIFSSQVDLGLKGAFFIAKQLNSHHNSKHQTSISQDIL